MLTYRRYGEKWSGIMNISIISVDAHNTNPFYDPRTCRNGGGYYQPDVTISLSNGGTIAIQDTSCGDFGDRYSAQYISRKGNVLATCDVDFVDDRDGQFDTDFDRFPALVALIRRQTGYALA